MNVSYSLDNSEPDNYTLFSNTSSVWSGCTNFTQDCTRLAYHLPEEDFIPSPLDHGLVVALMVLYIVIIILAIIGNLIVIVVIFVARMIRSVTDMFVVSLAISDLFICVLNMPVQLVLIVTNEWTLGVFMCKFCSYIQAVTIVSNILTLMAIAIDRYLVICHTVVSRNLHTKKKGWVVLFIVWFVSLLVACPQLFLQNLSKRLKVDTNKNIIGIGYLCVEFYPRSQQDSKIYSITIFACVYLLPVCVMALSYGAIAHRLWVRHPIGDMLENPRTHERNMNQKKRLTKMLILLVLAFTMLWFPFFTASLYREFMESSIGFRVPMAILQLIGYSNSCVNPIIYTFLNKKFQTEFRRLFKRKSPTTVNVQPHTPKEQTNMTHSCAVSSRENIVK